MCGGVLALGATASGQNALGDGRALDANLSASGNRYNTKVRDTLATIRFNEAVINGQVGGGRSFRGSLGYRPTSEFGGRLGSDDTYGFRRDAASGALVGAGIRGTDALRYQFALATGGSAETANLPPLISNAFVDPRGGGVSNAATVSGMRSVAQFQTQSAILPTILGYMPGQENNRIAIIASPLRGLATAPLTPTPAPGGKIIPNGLTGLERTAYGVTGIAETTAVSGPANAKIGPDGRPIPEAGNSAGTGPIDNRLVPAGTGYDRVMQSLTQNLSPRSLVAPVVTPAPNAVAPGGAGGPPGADAPAGAAPKAEPPPKPAWVLELDRLRADLRREANPERGGASEPSAPGPLPSPEVNPGASPGAGPEGSGDPNIAADVREALRKMKPKVDALIEKLPPAEPSAAAFVRRMAEGQELLSKGRWFDAEAKFTMALIAKPNDQMASVGRAHAQLGAGLFLSAALNLRLAMADHPELIPTRYGKDLLPSAERAETLVAQLRADLAKPEPVLGADAGLLLAYLGFQFDNAAWKKEGLAELKARTPTAQGRAGGAKAASLVELMEALWGE
jgi:hypothetical protein